MEVILEMEGRDDTLVFVGSNGSVKDLRTQACAALELEAAAPWRPEIMRGDRLLKEADAPLRDLGVHPCGERLQVVMRPRLRRSQRLSQRSMLRLAA